MRLKPTETRVESFVFIDAEDGAALQYDGGYEWTRDGGSFEITMPVDADPGTRDAMGRKTAKHLTERSGDIGVAIGVSGEIFGSGIIEACDVLEDALVVRVDDGSYVDPDEVPDDVFEETEDA